MKNVIMIIVSLIVNHSSYSSNDLKVIRDYYYAVCLKENTVVEFERYLINNTDVSLIEVKGYLAVACFLRANYYVNPFKKWDSFKKGRKKLDGLISEFPNSIELRFLRLTIQDNLPSFLNYNNSIKEDKTCIYKQLHTVLDEDLKSRITNYLRHHSMASIK